MRHEFLDRYSRRESVIHRMQPGWKVVVSLVIVVSIVAPTHLDTAVHAGTAVILGVITALSRVPFRFVLRRLVLFEPLVVGIALLSLLRPDGITIFATIVVKSTLCLWVAILLANSTPFDALLAVLRRARFPGVLVTVLALFYRYIFVLIDEAERMTRARRSRTVDRSKVGTWWVLATVVGQLFIRSTERAERIYLAMQSRGWK